VAPEVPGGAAMTSKTRARVCLFVFMSLLWSAASWGQTTGTIRGTATDQTGAVVPGATVTVTLTGTDSVRTVKTDKDGAFDIPELAVGTYVVDAEAAGFKKFVAKDVVVTIGHVNLVTIALTLGGSTETVTVEADAAQVETTSSQLGGVMTDASIRELPLESRNAYALLQLQPGVQSQLGADLFLGSDNPGVVSVNGGRGRSNNYMVNGGDGNDIFVNSPAIQPSPDAIEEFRVLTNTFDAEYGRNSGSVVNVVTKSGTNAIHGDVYEFLRNDVLNTKGYFDSTVPDYKQNQFGATLGGPIKKDQTFIFGSYEGNRLIQGLSSGVTNVPFPEEVNGDFSQSHGSLGPDAFSGAITDPAFAAILGSRGGGACGAAVQTNSGVNLFAPPPTNGYAYATIFPQSKIPTSCFDPTAVALYNQYVSKFSAIADSNGNVAVLDNLNEHSDQFTVRFDHKITNSQQFSAYYYFDNDHAIDPYSNFQAAGADLPGFGGIFGTRVQQWNLSHTWTIGSTAVNEFRFNYFREGQRSENHPVNILAGPNGLHDSCGTFVAASECFQDQSNSTANLLNSIGIPITPTQAGQLGITTQLPNREGVPFIQTSGFAIGNNSEGELPQVGNTFQWTDNYTKTFSKHTLKFGGDVRRARFDQFLYFDVNGSYTFTTSPVSDQIGGVNDSFPAFFLGTPNSFTQGAAQGENDRNTALYLFAQDSYKLRPNLTLNYGLRWELNTPFYDTGNRLQTFRPGQATTQYPCWLSQENAANLQLNPGDCGQNSGTNNAIFPLGLVFPGDKGVPRGLTSTYYKAFAPRIGIAYSPGFTEGWLGKLFGGPGKSSIRAGWGIFYNPIEQLVLEQFSAEPPFGGSSFVSSPLFNLPYLTQGGTVSPNPFGGVIHQTPNTPCAVDTPGGPNGCVDWSTFRSLLLFGEFAPHLKSQYAEQYNLTVERQLTKDMMLRVSYVGTQAHHLLASHDLNAGNIQTCLGIAQIAADDPSGNSVLSGPGGSPGNTCGPFGADSQYFIPAGVTIPSVTQPVQPFKVPQSGCNGLLLPYSGAPGNTPQCIPAGTVVGANGITLVGTRPFSSPNCIPLSGSLMTGCPQDGVPVFSNIFAEDTSANSNYNALQVSVEKSYSHGLLFQASYTYSKAIDQAASFENELNPLNFEATRGTSLLSAKHRFVFSPVWELPIPKYDGAKGKALDGWGASAIITYQSGFPIRVWDPNDTELESSEFFESANTPTIVGSPLFENPKSSANVANGTPFFLNPNSFADATTNSSLPFGVFGNSPHSLCCGPPISDTDLVISKKTPVSERLNTEFRAEFYNAFNHTQFGNPDGNFADSTFGQILKTRIDSRVMQFGLKLLF
jgi:outer membrane receptor protein involved in Fe transport